MRLLDAGPVIGAASPNDQRHQDCVRVLSGLTSVPLMTVPCITEVCYFLSKRASADVEASFLRSVGTFIEVVDLEPGDFERMANLVETYASLPLGAADASVVAVAERLGISEIITLDVRHFSVVRPSHIDHFTLSP